MVQEGENMKNNRKTHDEEVIVVNQVIKTVAASEQTMKDEPTAQPGETVTVSKHAREKAHLSASEALLLLLLYSVKNGIKSPDLKKELLFMGNNDYDEVEEAMENMRTGAYVRYAQGRWTITDDGIKLLKSISKFESAKEEAKP